MGLILHKPDAACSLADHYKKAFAHAVELLIVNAYLTEWDTSLVLNLKCQHFRMIIGKDFGITRKEACYAVMGWLPRQLRAHFLVADEIGGFHPKAVFWREAGGKQFAIIGSSNLTAAAFAANYEANIFCQLSQREYQIAKTWVQTILNYSVPVSRAWLEKYTEAPRKPRSGNKKHGIQQPDDALVPLHLPKPPKTQEIIVARRKLLAEYRKNCDGLIDLFRKCASGKVTSDSFYLTLPEYWGGSVGGRLQGKGWERRGQDSDFRALSESFLRIVDASADDRDDVTIEEIDRLANQNVSTRRAFLSEMLCLRFPKLFPVVNKPVKKYLKHIEFSAPPGASEGAIYLDLAQKLRVSLRQNPDHPAKNLAELDAVIWLAYHD